MIKVISKSLIMKIHKRIILRVKLIISRVFTRQALIIRIQAQLIPLPPNPALLNPRALWLPRKTEKWGY